MIKSLNKYRNVHFIGIGGSGMSGLALILKSSGVNVTGSDEKPSPILSELQLAGVKLTIGHSASSLDGSVDLAIYSGAVPESNAERAAAAAKNIPSLSYPQAVGLLTRDFTTVAVCGTHGKTTTTSMTAAAFIASGLDPDVLVGAPSKELSNHNARHGKGKYFVLESCEHMRSFMNYSPSHIIVTNIELDHLDYYKNIEDYKRAFVEFISKLPAGGLLVANGDDPNVTDVIEGLTDKKIILYGRGENNLYRIIGNDIHYKGKKIFSFNLKVPGLHNVYNATAVFALCHELGLDLTKVTAALNNYSGASRRFEVKGVVGKTTIIDDYAHHPSEIAATLRAARQKYGNGKKILCIFQPHQYSRTRHLIKGFTEAFTDADQIFVSDILRVRDSDEDVAMIDPESFVRKLSEKHAHVRYGGALQKTINTVRPTMRDFDVIITMGAGDVWKVADALLETR